MPLILTDQVDARVIDAVDLQQIYNGMDSCVTLEVLNKLLPELTPDSELIYKFERGLQAPALAMSMSGVCVDLFERNNRIRHLENEERRFEEYVNILAKVVWGTTINPRSPVQVGELLYGHMSVPEIYTWNQGQRRVTVDEDALKKIIITHPYAAIIAKLILHLRGLRKTLGVLRSPLSSDKRLRFWYKVTGTKSGRWASSANPFKEGTNGQNITDSIRQIVVADPGWKLAGPDLEQAESRIVGLISGRLTGDWKYLTACESEDLHTYVCRLVWPHLPWTGDITKDRAIADGPCPGTKHSMRDIAKRLGHASNYGGSPEGVARAVGVPSKLVFDFQHQYFTNFPELRRWHYDVAYNLETAVGIPTLTTFLRRPHQFLDRKKEAFKQALSHEPQSAVGDIMNVGLWRLWKYSLDGEFPIRVLFQVHDQVGFLYKEEQETQVLAKAKSLLEIPISVEGRSTIIPVEMLVGWNWGKFDKNNPDKNPDGLKKWSGKDERKRTVNINSVLYREFL